jgi:DNA gyrase subunit A
MSLEALSRPRQKGVNAIQLKEDDRLIDVRMTNGDNEVIIANRNGRAIRFHESKVRAMGRAAAGVKGMTLDKSDPSDEVVGMVCLKNEGEETILVVSEQGYGKRSHIDDYRRTNRGAKGVKTINITEKTGKLVTIKNVNEGNDIMIINKSGIAIRMSVLKISLIGRATQGVRLINLEKRHDEIASVCKVLSEADEKNAEEKAQSEAIENHSNPGKQDPEGGAEDEIKGDVPGEDFTTGEE